MRRAAITRVRSSALAARFVASLLVACLTLVLAGCGSDGGETAATTAGGGTPDGAELYRLNCSSCHGADLRGTDQGPSQLSIVYEPNHHSDDSYRSAIANGVQAHHWNFGPMPPVGGLSAAEVDAIIAYIRSVQGREGFEPYPPN